MFILVKNKNGICKYFKRIKKVNKLFKKMFKNCHRKCNAKNKQGKATGKLFKMFNT